MNWLIGLVVAWMLLALVWAAVDAVREKLSRWVNGVQGAASNPTRCRECTGTTAESKQQRANEERRRAAAERRRRTEEEEQRRTADERRHAKVKHDVEKRFEEYREQLAREEREKEEREREEEERERRRVEEEELRRKREELRRAEDKIERQQRRAEHLKSTQLPNFLINLHPRKFELFVCEVYRKLGWKAYPTPYAGDGGVDGFLRREGELYLLQCKRVKGSVGCPVLQQLSGCIAHHRAAGGIVVTTGKVSRQARQWAAGNHIEIVGLHRLVQMVRKAYPEDEVVPADWHPSR